MDLGHSDVSPVTAPALESEQLSVLFLFLTESLALSKQLTRNAISQPIGTATSVDFSTQGMVLASRRSAAVCVYSAAAEKGFAHLVAYRKGSLKQLCDAMRDVWIFYRDLGKSDTANRQE